MSCLVPVWGLVAPQDATTESSTDVAAAFDAVLEPLLRAHHVPGAAVGVAIDGKLVLARAYGFGDLETKEPVRVESLFRIASLSKPITAVAVLALVDEGRLSLEAAAFEILGPLEPPAGTQPDPRLERITVRDLLRHSAGWDRGASFDPMFRPEIAARALGLEPPAEAEDVIRYMLGVPLDFDPGTRYAYSNFGYAVLGRIVERASGQSYEAFVRERVLAPLGIRRMRLGRSLPAEAFAGEVRYHDFPGAEPVDCVLPGADDRVPHPYGGFYLEAMDAHGGWVGSVVDLLRFVTGLDGRRVPEPVLGPASLELMLARPPAPLWTGSETFYALGWNVHPRAEGTVWWHTGSLPGSMALLVRLRAGVAFAGLFNTRDREMRFLDEFSEAMIAAIEDVERWPEADLFELYAE